MIIVSFSRHIKFISLFLMSSCLDFGCAPLSTLFGSRGRNYQYVYEMAEPAASKELKYDAPKFTIWFTIDQGAVNYTLRNMSTLKLSVLAGNASMGINGKFSPVRTSASYYGDSGSYPFTSSVLSNGFLQDFFLPRNNIYFNGTRWIERVLFPTKDNGNAAARKAIQKNVGSEVALVLPIRVGSELSEYTFKFKISRVKMVPSDSVLAMEPRIPPPPMPKHPPTALETWSSVAIVTSIVLFSIYILTREKTFPGGL